MRSGFNTRVIYSVFLAMTLVSLGLLAACRRGEEKKAPPPNAVTVETVGKGKVADASEYMATLISRQSVSLQPQVAGNVKEIYVTAGDVVRKGQLLLLLDPEAPDASVASAQASAAAQQAQILQARDSLKVLEEQRHGLESTLDTSQRQYDRYSTLYSQRSASQQEYEQYKNVWKQSQANLEANQAQIQAQRAAIVTSRKQYEQSVSQVKQATAQLNYYKIRAPFDGIISDVPVRIGNYALPTTSLLNLTDNKTLELNISIPTEEKKKLKLGLPVEMLDNEHRVIGKTSLFFVAPNINPLAQTVLAKGKVTNIQGPFQADELINARIIWRYFDGVRIPTQAVTHMNGRDFVFTLDRSSGKPVAKQHMVALGEIQGSYYTVESGVKPGDELITSGTQKLADGAQVRIMKK